MNRTKRGRPSPAIVIAVLALVAALAGTAIAGPTATTSVSRSKAKKDAKKQANKQINKKVLPVGAEQLDSLTVRKGTPVNVPNAAGQNAAWVVRTATASCQANEKLISGTGEWTNENANNELAIQEVVYTDSTVTVKGANDNGNNRTLQASALCLRPGA